MTYCGIPWHNADCALPQNSVAFIRILCHCVKFPGLRKTVELRNQHNIICIVLCCTTKWHWINMATYLCNTTDSDTYQKLM